MPPIYVNFYGWESVSSYDILVYKTPPAQENFTKPFSERKTAAMHPKEKPMELYETYRPITATPFRSDNEYTEAAPCDALKPYIRCFWGSRSPVTHRPEDRSPAGIVTPDTCVDIIFTVNYTDNCIKSDFCGIDDRTFITGNQYDAVQKVSTFAIRFYAWTAVLFADESMKETRNGFFDAEIYFRKLTHNLQKHLFDTDTLEERISLAEKYLFNSLRLQRKNSLFMRATEKIIEHSGNIKALELATDLNISSRQIERIFLENMGISPKKAASLIRYQCLWQSICFHPAFQIQDAVYQYGYTDQAHLLNDFRKKHSLPLRTAKKTAFENVDFLQEISMNSD